MIQQQHRCLPAPAQAEQPKIVNHHHHQQHQFVSGSTSCPNEDVQRTRFHPVEVEDADFISLGCHQQASLGTLDPPMNVSSFGGQRQFHNMHEEGSRVVGQHHQQFVSGHANPSTMFTGNFAGIVFEA